MLIRIQAGTLPFPSESFLFLDLGYVIKYVSPVGFLFCQFGSGLSPFGTGKGVNCAKFGKGERGGGGIRSSSMRKLQVSNSFVHVLSHKI